MREHYTVAVSGEGPFCVVIKSDEETVVRELTVGVSGETAEVLKDSARTRELVAFSVEWLLARESPSAIHTAFDLDDITRYFPEYQAARTAWLSNAVDSSV